MPHGGVVGDPYSSWLKKLPRRDGLHDKEGGAMMSAQRQMGCCSRRA